MRISQYEKIVLHFPSKEMVCRRCARIDGAILRGLKKMGDWYVAPSQKAESIDGRTAYKVIWRCRACGKFSHPRYTKPVDFSGGKGREYKEYTLDSEFISHSEEKRAARIDERRRKGENVLG